MPERRPRSQNTQARRFTTGPNVQPGRPPGAPPPDGGRLDHRRQSGEGAVPPDGEDARPTDTGRKGA